MSVPRKNAVAVGQADSAVTDVMKAIVQDRFGPPETLRVENVERPEIGSTEVLIKVHAAGSTPMTGTWSVAIRASPASWVVWA